MNVVQVPRRFVRDEWGGTETVILETSKQLLRSGHRTEILCPEALADSREESFDGVPVRRVPYFYPYWGLGSEERRMLDKKGGNMFSFALLRELSRFAPLDLIHLHTMKRVGGIARYVARKRGVPYVVSLHGGLFDVPAEEAESWTAPTRRAFEWGRALGWWVGSRRVLDDAAAILCVGEEERRRVAERYPNQRVLQLPNGVDPDKWSLGVGERFRAGRGIPPEAHVVLEVGRIDPQKNQALLVELLPDLVRARPTTHLVLIGAVTSPAYLDRIERRVAELGLERRVTIIPGLRADASELRDAFRAADVFVLPSVHEPFGIVILEAWAAGLPVIASRVGGIPSFVEEGVDGLLFDVDHPDELVARFASLDAARCRALSSAGRAKAIREYSWEAITARLIRVYEEVTRAHPVPA